MKFSVLLVLIVMCGTQGKRLRRDIGLDPSHQHDHHHDHHIAQETQVQQNTVEFKGYGQDRPNPTLSVDLQPPVAAVEQEIPVVQTEIPQEPQKSPSKGYPRENPPNSLHYPSNQREQESQSSVLKETVDNNNRQQNTESSDTGLPGNAGKDFPTYSKVPETSFNCKNQEWPGYYADEEAGCQVFHICHDNRKSSFLCPNGTLFNQQFFVCDWWYNVDCAASKTFFHLNGLIGIVPEKRPAEEQRSQLFEASYQRKEQTLLPQQSSESLVKETPAVNYLPPTPVESEIPSNGTELTAPESKAPEVSPSSFDSLRNPPELSQGYLPPPQQQSTQQGTPGPLESFAPTETVVEEQVKVEVPHTSYLPPLSPVEAEVPSIEQKILQDLQPPSTDYLPPSPGSATNALLPSVPPQVANIPTAMEAIANGILQLPQLPSEVSVSQDAKTESPAAALNLNYLPPPL